MRMKKSWSSPPLPNSAETAFQPLQDLATEEDVAVRHLTHS
jgi:hypothetical protein